MSIVCAVLIMRLWTSFDTFVSRTMSPDGARFLITRDQHGTKKRILRPVERNAILRSRWLDSPQRRRVWHSRNQKAAPRDH